MKKNWEELGQQVQQLQTSIEAIIEVLPQSPAMYKRERALKLSWDKFKKLFNRFDGFVSPVDPISVKPPWDNPEFHAAWNLWKEYLIEQHGVFVRSRSELMSLKLLKEFSENNPEKAIKYLEYAIAGRYQNFFKLNENETTKTESGQTVFKL